MTTLNIINIIFLIVAFPSITYVVVKIHALETRTAAQFAQIGEWSKNKDHEFTELREWLRGVAEKIGEVSDHVIRIGAKLDLNLEDS